MPLTRPHEPQEHAQRRGFAGAVGPEKTVDHPARDRQVQTFDGRGGAEVFGQTPCLDGDRRRHRFSFSTARRSMTAITTKNHRTGKIGHQGPGPDHPFSCASATKSIMFTLLVDVPRHEPCRRAEARIAHTIDSRARRWKIHRTGEANRSATPGETPG